MGTPGLEHRGLASENRFPAELFSKPLQISRGEPGQADGTWPLELEVLDFESLLCYTLAG